MDFSSTPIIELAAIVAQHLQQRGVDVVLVGGLAVEIYAENLYLTKDIDMVNTNYLRPSQLHKIMGELGFHKLGRVYVHATTVITVEFPPGPLAIGRNLIKNTTVVQVANGAIPILYAIDVVKDRIAAFIHWQDKQSLVQAMSIMLKHGLKPEELKIFCESEGDESSFTLLDTFFRHTQKLKLENMAQLEAVLTKILLRDI
jgi:Nucleotidyl transferase of unknown function (DUF2204)